MILTLFFTLALALLLPGQAHAPEPPPALASSMAAEHPDVDLLARIIHAEARGESLEGMVAVGAVVLNRVSDPRFPDTVKAVIFEPGQFQPVGQGLLPTEAGERSREAARRALEGENPVPGAVYFYADWSTCGWIRANTETVAVIGVHVFAK